MYKTQTRWINQLTIISEFKKYRFVCSSSVVLHVTHAQTNLHTCLEREKEREKELKEIIEYLSEYKSTAVYNTLLNSVSNVFLSFSFHVVGFFFLTPRLTNLIPQHFPACMTLSVLSLTLTSSVSFAVDLMWSTIHKTLKLPSTQTNLSLALSHSHTLTHSNI